MKPPAAYELLRAVRGPSIAVMLYGSYARGDWSADSDVDVLQVVGHRREHYRHGAVSVSVYTVDQLRRMARAGSLFLLHLSTEGRILSDPGGVLAQVLNSYRPPPTYAPLWAEMEIVAELLYTPSTGGAVQVEGVARLALYLVRNAAILRHMELFGRACFAVPELAHRLDCPELEAVFHRREDPSELNEARLALARTVLERLFRTAFGGVHASLEAAAVNLELEHPIASSLALHLLAGNRTLAYGDIFLDPLVV